MPSRFLTLRDLREKSSGAEDHSALRWAQILCTTLSPTKEADLVFFSCLDQRPSVAASDMVSFGGSKNEGMDDSVSLAASDAEELLGSLYDPAPLRLASQESLRRAQMPNFSTSCLELWMSWV